MKKAGLVGLILTGIIMTGCTSNQNELPQQNSSQKTSNTTIDSKDENSESESSAQAESTNQSSTSTNTSTTIGSTTVAVSADEAIKAFQQAYPEASVTSLDLDTSFGTYYYEVKGVDDSVEYEVKVNGETGELTKEREEKLDADERNGIERENESLSLDGIMTIEEAADIALKAVGKGEAVEWSLERELTTTYWEVKIVNGRSETSVKLDAKTGDILETELDD
ncbi:PepSY domain-containing protein [Enterococcus sp. BWM-S5]|uniref:PepSY domain-containing protein n=1 Tax=Enterococcus larvae TaxID=2794352 RepID=A0ABS4CQC3_9ENTE|nr:PepSY domain-containing protein [Enterococcus larvae]MBP1048383.1 PepSY domain-containing protein [Enterococcus larvae]